MMRGARAFLTLVALPLLCGCPYEAPFQPEGRLAPLRGTVVGTWLCRVTDDPKEVLLLLGWAGGSEYHLFFSPTAEQLPATDDTPLVLTAIARQISGREIWSVWADKEPLATRKIAFAQLIKADRHQMTFSWLGNGEPSTQPEIPPTPTALAQLLVSPQRKPEMTVQCARRASP